CKRADLREDGEIPSLDTVALVGEHARGEMRVAAPFGLGSCFDVGAVLTPNADHTLSLFQGRCVARLREARRQI
ncbi:MAG: hypothetical protein QOI89_960, partial [Solirubrobacteraceae bacterium]|nr:hypothetical protein [Solirubrobacteraceae bacterium]